MPKAKNDLVDEAFALYRQGMKLTNIGKKLNIPDGTIRRWKSTYKWDSERSDKNSERSFKPNIKKKAVVNEVEDVLNNTELTDKQKLFCLFYVRSFNATKAYQKAYGCNYETAASIAYRLLEKDGVKAEIQKLKQSKLNRAYLSEEDIFQKYMDIAFADITDFLEFGQEEVPVMTVYGPMIIKDEETGEKVKVTKVVNTVRFKESSNVDGSIISEVKQGKDGASIKLSDRLRALQWLADHMDLATDEQRARIDLLKMKASSYENNIVENEKEQVQDWKSAIIEIAKRREAKNMDGD